MTDYAFQTLLADAGGRVIFRGVVGSRAYGTNRPGSDEDVRGVVLVPPVEYALLAAPPEQVADARNDRVYYSLRRFAKLTAASNPNALELFWLPSDCVLLDSPRFARLRENRALFLSRRAVDTHVGYALAQIKKARRNPTANREATVEGRFKSPPIRASLRAADNSFDHGFRVSRSTLSRPAQNIERARSLGGVFTRAVPRAVSNTRKKTRPWGAPPAAFRSRQTIVWNFRVNVVRRCTKWVQLSSVFDGRMGMLLG